eukprot:g1936.t1
MSGFAENENGSQPMRDHVRPGDDIPSDVIPEGRPKLKLKARSKPKTQDAASSAASSSIFGQAKPREQVLKAKGVDASELDSRVDAKVTRLPRMNREQQATYEAILNEVSFAKSELEKAETDEAREAATKEIAAKEEQVELFLDGVRSAMEEKLKASKTDGRPRFERPSERRRRMEERNRAGGRGGHGGDSEKVSQGGTAIPTGTEANPNADTKVNVSQDGTANDADVKDGSDAPDSNGKPSIEADDEPAESAQEDSLRDAFREIFQTITKDSTTTSVSKKKFKQALMSIPSLGE